MSESSKEHIAFNVETERVLQILSSEIYDSPQAFLRENVQNAYDAILMRCVAQGIRIEDRKIQIVVNEGTLSVLDDGIGMTEYILKENFWHAGSSGKKSELALKAGVIGTFGIGAMANFGVCTKLRVESRSIESDITVVSEANRADLRIGQDCIALEKIKDGREYGTHIIAGLDVKYSVDEQMVINYLKQYVRFLPVPVFVNSAMISQEKFTNVFGQGIGEFEKFSSKEVSNNFLSCTLQVCFNSQARVLVQVSNISLNGNSLQGEGIFLQGAGHIMGFRGFFGLAPAPVPGAYNFGGFLNLNALVPTAGREALSQESINVISNLISLVEVEVSKDMADTDYADDNQQFQQYILAHSQIALAKNVTIATPFGREERVRLGAVKDFEPDKAKFYYSGRDKSFQQRFSGDSASLLVVSQNQPRRKLHLRYLREIAQIQEAPDVVNVKPIPQTELKLEEAAFLLRIKSILLDSYFMFDVDISFADISHNLLLSVAHEDEHTKISIARQMSAARMVIEAYDAAPEVFRGFAVDFVREQIYPKIRDRVPSSTQQGRDALHRRLKENEELFEYDLSDFGDIRSILADFLSGKTNLQEIFQASAGRSAGQRQEVRAAQIGSVEDELPGITDAPAEEGAEFLADPYVAHPPILRPDVDSEMKILTVEAENRKLNNFRMFLSLSDRMFKIEGEFLEQPHTTKVMWGSHRVIYVFTDATGKLHLYYDIKLKEPLETQTTGGEMIPTTTIVTKNRIFVPILKELESAFRIYSGSKEFFVRFDSIP